MVAASPVAWNTLMKTVFPEKADVLVLLCQNFKEKTLESIRVYYEQIKIMTTKSKRPHSNY